MRPLPEIRCSLVEEVPLAILVRYALLNSETLEDFVDLLKEVAAYQLEVFDQTGLESWLSSSKLILKAAETLEKEG